MRNIYSLLNLKNRQIMTKQGNYTVYVVDDDPLYLANVEQTIRSNENIHVDLKTFSTGEECLEEVANTPPDIVVLDYYLNSRIANAMNGVQLLSKIKTFNSKIQAIMLSSQESIDIAVNSIKYGASDYVVKSETAFVRINNTLKNIVSSLYVGKEMKTYEKWNIAIAIFFVLLILGLSYWSILHL